MWLPDMSVTNNGQEITELSHLSVFFCGAYNIFLQDIYKVVLDYALFFLALFNPSSCTKVQVTRDENCTIIVYNYR